MSRRRWLLAALVVGIQATIVAPLVLGIDTLYLRDVLSTHLPMKVGQALEVEAGASGLIDPARDGQPLAGNPNALPFYPTSWLFVVFDDLWALNAHFWLHFLLAPFAMASFARTLGASRRGAWTAAAVYAGSGYLASSMSYFNLVTVAALAPWLASASIRAARGSRPALAAAGLVWGLMLVAGDPVSAGFALLVAALGVGLASATNGGRWRPAVGLLLGSVMAAPQLVELIRILPVSTRWIRGYDAEAAALGRLRLDQIPDLLLPFLSGRVDRVGPGEFWGHALYGGGLPIFLTLAPGLVALALLVGVERWLPVTRVGVGAIGLGLFLGFGVGNPLLARIVELPGGSLLRFPVKAWLLVAIGLALLGGQAWERIFEEGSVAARRRLGLVGLGIAALFGAVALWLGLGGGGALAVGRSIVPAGWADPLVALELGRWSRSAGWLAAIGLGVALLSRRGRRDPALAGVALLALHLGTQAILLAPAMPTDRAALYSGTAPLAARTAGLTRVAHGGLSGLFGDRSLSDGGLPDGRTVWLARRAWAGLHPFGGVELGLRYSLVRSPEGLETFLSRLAADAVRMVEDPDRLRLLRIWGVEGLVLSRSLRGGDWAAVATDDSFGRRTTVWAPPEVVPAIRIVEGARWRSDPQGALSALLDPEFDPVREVVLAGEGIDRSATGSSGEISVALESSDRLVVDVVAERPSHLVVERSHLPLYRARVDDVEVPVLVGNLYRVAVPVSAGRHRVEIWLEQSPGRWAAASAAAAALLLVGAMWPRGVTARLRAARRRENR